MSSLSCNSGTKLSQHTHTSSPPGTKLSQHTHTSSPTGTKLSLLSRSRGSPGTKLSQHAQKGPFQPVLPEQGELCTAATTKKPRRENFIPHPPPRPPAGRTLYRTKRQTRYKTLPTHPYQQPNRYKTPPTRPKRPISTRFARAGRTLYRFHPHDPQQGELCTAPSAKPGTKLSQHTHTSSPTGTKLSPHAPKGPFPRVLAEQGELCTAATTKKPSRENFVPHQAPNPVQNSPSAPVLQRFREKVRPAHLKTAFFASFASAGRIISRTSKQQATQGELFRALGIEQEVLTKVVCADI